MLISTSKPRPKSNPFGSSLNTRSFSAGSGFRFGFNGKENQGELSDDDYDYGARIYDGRLGRWFSVDPKFEKYSWQSSYAYYANSPVEVIDYNGLGKESTHTDKDGKVLAVYNDGDNGVYKHENTTNFNPQTQSLAKSGKGVTKMGETLTPLSFANFETYEATNGKTIVPGSKARIDFNSNWATEKVNEILQENPDPFTYGINARGGGKWDLKTKSIDGEKAFYFGSKLFGKYASARDAGNFTAGAIAQKSVLPNAFFDFGYGVYNLSGNSVFNSFCIITADLIVLDLSTVAGAALIHQQAEFGENPLSKAGIEAGKAYVRELEK